MYSDVSGKSEQKDHAVFAQQELIEGGYVDYEVVVADDRTLQIDYDNVQCYPAYQPLPEQFHRVLHILKQALGVTDIEYKRYRSKGGNTHVIVHLPISMPIMDRVAWQAAFGSDPVREALHINSIRKKELNPILLFMHKRRDQKLLPAPEPVGRRFRTEESDAGQAGTPK